MKQLAAYIWLGLGLLYSCTAFGQDYFECLGNSFQPHNEVTADLVRTGVWMEKESPASTSLGCYQAGSKEGFWVIISDSLVEFSALEYYFAGDAIFSIHNFSDTLRFSGEEQDPLQHKLFEQFGVKPGDKIPLSSLYNNYYGPFSSNSNLKELVSIKVAWLPSLSLVKNQLLMEFPTAANATVFLNFKNWNPELGGIEGFRLQSIRTTFNGLYHGRHYFWGVDSYRITSLNYEAGWLQGAATLGGGPVREVVGIFEKGKLVSATHYSTTTEGQLEKIPFKIDEEFKQSYLGGFLHPVNSPIEYISALRGCNACASNLFNGFLGFDLSDLDFPPNLFDLQLRGMEGIDFMHLRHDPSDIIEHKRPIKHRSVKFKALKHFKY